MFDKTIDDIVSHCVEIEEQLQSEYVNKYIANYPVWHKDKPLSYNEWLHSDIRFYDITDDLPF
jgi:hypothetical protein